MLTRWGCITSVLVTIQCVLVGGDLMKPIMLMLCPSLQSSVTAGFQLIHGLGNPQRKGTTKHPGQTWRPGYAN